MIPHIDGKVNRVRHKNRPFGDLPDFLRKTVARARRGCYDKNHLIDCGRMERYAASRAAHPRRGRGQIQRDPESGPVSEPSDGPEAVSGDGGGMEAAVRRLRREQARHDRGQRHRHRGRGRARVRLPGRVRQENQEPQRLRRCVHDGRALVHARQRQHHPHLARVSLGA